MWFESYEFFKLAHLIEQFCLNQTDWDTRPIPIRQKRFAWIKRHRPLDLSHIARRRFTLTPSLSFYPSRWILIARHLAHLPKTDGTAVAGGSDDQTVAVLAMQEAKREGEVLTVLAGLW